MEIRNFEVEGVLKFSKIFNLNFINCNLLAICQRISIIQPIYAIVKRYEKFGEGRRCYISSIP